jgi:polysaccharide biosynthesis protein PelG
MAGIGFELRKMIDSNRGLISRVRGYACAGLISSGPWLVTIFTLGILSAFAPHISTEESYDFFQALVTYAFAFSLILVGVLQLTVTRKVADWLYTKQYTKILPAFNACFAVVALAHFVVGVAFAVVAELPLAISVVATALFVVLGVTWLALIWLGITREFDTVLKGYALGAALVFGVVATLERPASSLGLLSAYTSGQAVALLYLVRAIVQGLDTKGERNLEVLGSVIEFPKLLIVGFAYNAGIWIDKIIFWVADGVGPHPCVLYHPIYDSCCFLAYLTVIPALAVNLVRVETEFYECYRSYFGAILGGRPLRVIEHRREVMLDNMREGMIRLLRIQGAITGLVLIFAPFILKELGLPPSAVRIFRAVCVGAFCHVMLLITILMQLYFDLKTQALITSLMFVVLNAGLALVSVNVGPASYGFGYAIATMITVLTGYVLLARASTHLDYYVFTSQPISGDGPDKDAPIPDHGN